MNIEKNVSLKAHSTMRLGGSAAYYTELTHTEQIPELVSWAKTHHVGIKVIGDGSNIVWKDEGFNGLLVKNLLRGFTVIDDANDVVSLTIASGENWDEMVAKTVAMDLYGIECLSLIPGTVGGTPVQNVGAYGQDISQVLESVSAYDTVAEKTVDLTNVACNFGYRSSRFKHADIDQFIITSITVKLSKKPLHGALYPAVARWLADQAKTAPTPADLRAAVIAIRSAKLPDPKLVANNGSFFANPVISSDQFRKVQGQYPNVAAWELPNNAGYKISAAWLIETAGYKDHHDADTGMGTWPMQPLVLVNESAKNTSQLLQYRDTIADKVAMLFGITLVQEPELLPHD